MTDTTSHADLRSRITGDVLLPGDAGYDNARSAWNRSFTHAPAVIVVAATPADVAQAVRHAAAEGLGLAVQATGHGVAATADGGVLVLTRNLRHVSIDAVGRTARIGAGSPWGPVLEAAQAHGLAPLLGSSPGVGAVGYTLGGGVGWLSRTFGSAVDSVVAFDVVTADGEERRVSATENADLFWALRGGGGGALAVVTAMEVELFPVTTVYAGSMLYPAEQARDVIVRYADWVAHAPDELTTEVRLMNFPPLPHLPEAVRGQSFAIVRGCYTGDVEDGARLLDSWRAIMPPAIDLWGELPFADAATISNDPVDPMPTRATGAWLRDVDASVADAMVAAALPAEGPRPIAFAAVRHLGGAVARGDREGTALGNRDAAFLLQALGVAPTAEAIEALEARFGRLRQSLAEHLTGGVFLNFLEGDERRRRTKDAFSPEAYERLRKLKATYDPGDVFRFGVDLT